MVVGITAVVTTGLVIAVGVVLLVFFGGLAGITYLLSQNLLSIVGTALLIFSGVALIRGRMNKTVLWLAGIGLVLLLIPFVSGFFGSFSIL